MAKRIEAARVLNPLFMQQFWSGNLALYQKLQQDKTPLGQARLHYFWLNKRRAIGVTEIQWQTPHWNLDASLFYQRRGGIAKQKLRFTLSAERCHVGRRRRTRSSRRRFP